MNKRQSTALGIILFIVFGIGYCLGFSYNAAVGAIGAVLMIISLSLAVVFGIINAYNKKRRHNKKED